MKWTGDVDLNDGKLQQLYVTYMDRLKFISGIGLEERIEKSCLLQDILTCIRELSEDMKVISSGKSCIKNAKEYSLMFVSYVCHYLDWCACTF